MIVIFLDDDERRQARMKSILPCIIQVFTADETIEAIKAESRIDYLFLDHDLGGEVYVNSNVHNTGMTVAKWLADNQWDIGTIIIHTYNYAGGAYMYEVLKDKYAVVILPFITKDFDDFLKGISDDTTKRNVEGRPNRGAIGEQGEKSL